ncbi:protein of unknown function [Stenotrophomonas maltophilia]|nr:protein of unknown function [Stenotrophomonas maltophilia]
MANSSTQLLSHKFLLKECYLRETHRLYFYVSFKINILEDKRVH